MNFKSNNNFKKFEYLIPVFLAISIISSCILISSKKYFWNDELYSFYLLSDESFFHMLYAFSNKINNTPPLYFIIGWIWAKIFGASELSLRLFSALGIASSSIILWLILRRVFGFWASSTAVIIVFCFSNEIIDQIAEARMYGLLLFVCTLGFFDFYSLITNNNDSKKTYIQSFLIHSIIVLTHIFGIVYSAIILFSLLLKDKSFNSFRPKLYLSIITGWLTLIPYIPTFFRQADAYVPRGWIPLKGFGYLIDFYSIYSFSILTSIVLFLGLVFLIIKSFKDRAKQEYSNGKIIKKNHEAKDFFIVLSTFLMILPVVVWGFSYFVKPIFVHRFLIPVVVSWVIILAYLISELLNYLFKFKDRNFKLDGIFNFQLSIYKLVYLVVLTLLSFYPLFYSYSLQKEEIISLDEVEQKYANISIVMQFSTDFHKLYYNSNFNKNYYFILDWDSAIKKGSGLFQPQEFKHMDAFRNVYPEIFKQNIVYSEEFLKRNSKFLILDHIKYNKDCSKGNYKKKVTCPRWFENRILSNKNFKVTPLNEVSENRRLYFVERTVY